MPQLSAVRRFALWLFSEPESPYVSTNVLIDYAAARDYLAAINAEDETPRVTIQHLFTAAVARVFSEFPEANGRVIGRRIERFDRVDVAAPVNLLDHDSSGGMELGLVLLHGVDRMSLREVAAKTSKVVAQERQGRPTHPLVRLGLPIAEHLPGAVFDTFLDLSSYLARSRLASPLMRRFLGVSTVITNPGAAFRDIKGGKFIGGSMVPPTRLIPLGSVFGISALQDEVFVVDGAPVVSPGLPVLFIFDHRLFDGVMCSRILRRLIELLQDPQSTFGPAGRT
jgi:pyruvate/2-oxoglutarate dehydrogenase complex dihydrolipoamide acyltransferase (E2) component